MANTFKGFFTTNLAAAQLVKFDQMASMVAAGSAIGYGLESNGSQYSASVAFPRGASLHQSVQATQGAAMYVWDTILFRSAATSMLWLPDLYGSAPANASMGIPMFGTDPRSIAFPAAPEYFTAFAVGAGALEMIFLQGDQLDI